MVRKIVADSSANLYTLDGADFASVPLKILAGDKEYVDGPELDVDQMVEELGAYKGSSSTSCPNVGDWLDAFGDAEEVFTAAITRNLSGSHNAALQAAQAYQEEHPDRKVCCLDTLTAGPEVVLILEKLRDLCAQELSFQEIQEQIAQYMTHTHLLFMLESLDNLAKNGRVSPLVAKAVGFLNIRIIATASEEGTIQQLHKARGEKRGMETLLKEMKARGFTGGKVRIAHSSNPQAAGILKGLLESEFPGLDISTAPCGGLCSFYAENGGLLVGFEG